MIVLDGKRGGFGVLAGFESPNIFVDVAEASGSICVDPRSTGESKQFSGTSRTTLVVQTTQTAASCRSRWHTLCASKVTKDKWLTEA